MARLLIVDSMGLLYRGHFAMSGRPLTAADGTVTSGVFHLVREILDQRDALSPDLTVAAMDYPGPTFRREIYPEYKANRPPMPDELRDQADIARELIPVLGIPMIQEKGLEADDIIASLTRSMLGENGQVYIITSDKDMLQLVGEGVTVLRPGRPGKPATEVDPEGVKRILGVYPEQVADLFALTGDSSDNVPGARGIGPKTAVSLLERFGTLDGIYGDIDRVTPPSVKKKLVDSREMVLLSRRLVDLADAPGPDIPISRVEATVPDISAASGILNRLGMASLVRRLRPVEDKSAEPVQGDLFSFPAVPVSTGDRFAVDIAVSSEDIEDLMKELPEDASLAVDTETTSTRPMDAEPVGLALASSCDRALYVPLSGPGAVESDSIREPLNRLLGGGRPVFAQNGRYDMQVLANMGVHLPVLSGDPMIADYLLRPEGRSHSLGSLSMAWLERPMMDYRQVLDGAADLREVPVERVADYCGADACTAWELSMRLRSVLEEDPSLLGIYDDLELPLESILAKMERRGVAIDMNALTELDESFSARIGELEEAARGLAGSQVNLNSPSQVSGVLFDVIGLEPVRKTPGGARSSGIDVLQALEGSHPFVSMVLEHRELSKLLNTYVRKLPGFVSPRDGLVHTSFSQTVTATGRLSSSGPNLQNIPIRTRRGREVRKCFHPGGEGEVFVTADYSQIELRVLAHLAGPGALRNAFMEGRDIHQATATAVFGDPGPDSRRKAKEVNFSILYGISPWGLSRRMGMDMSEAAGIIDRYMAEYPELETFFSKCITDADASGETRTILGRRRNFRGFPSASGNTRKAMERMVVNTTVQGSAADIIKLAMLRVQDRLSRDIPAAGLVLQVHDELVVAAPASASDEVAGMLSEEMAGAVDLDVPLVVDTGTGYNWMEAQH